MIANQFSDFARHATQESAGNALRRQHQTTSTGFLGQWRNREPICKTAKTTIQVFRYVDLLLRESRSIGKAMALEEQIYRLVALMIDQAAGAHEKTQRRWKYASTQWTSSPNELVDFIRVNAHSNLTLTDLEEKSHYSARHLQKLFREKFSRTPMQFVRRQRLTAAMERLQVSSWDDSVTSIARDCRYRFISNFSHDFHREFGVAPSIVLRASRERQAKCLTQCTAHRSSGPSEPVTARRWRPYEGLLLAPLLLFEPLDWLLVQGEGPFKLLQLFQGEHWHIVGILGCLAPAFYLLRVQASLQAVGTQISDNQLGGIQLGEFQQHREGVIRLENRMMDPGMDVDSFAPASKRDSTKHLQKENEIQ